jgi:hypothetical protein
MYRRFGGPAASMFMEDGYLRMYQSQRHLVRINCDVNIHRLEKIKFHLITYIMHRTPENEVVIYHVIGLIHKIVLYARS